MIDEPEVLEEGIKKLPEEVYEKYTVVRSAPYFLEFLSKTCNKGEGVRYKKRRSYSNWRRWK